MSRNKSYLIRFGEKLIIFAKKHVSHTFHLRPMVKYLIENYKGGELVGVEIGVLRGLNAFNMLFHLPIKRLYLLSPYAKYGDYEIYDEPDANYAAAKRHLKRFNDKIVWVRKLSEHAANDIPNNLDFVYIDGNHEYVAVKKDIELYWPKSSQEAFLEGTTSVPMSLV